MPHPTARATWRALPLALALLTPAWADDIRHGPVVYGTGGAHQHGPVVYGNGPDRREPPGLYRTHPAGASPERRHDAPPVIIVEPRIEIDRHRRPRDVSPRHPRRTRSIDRDRVGESHWFLEPDGARGRR